MEYEDDSVPCLEGHLTCSILKGDTRSVLEKYHHEYSKITGYLSLYDSIEPYVRIYIYSNYKERKNIYEYIYICFNNLQVYIYSSIFELQKQDETLPILIRLSDTDTDTAFGYYLCKPKMASFLPAPILCETPLELKKLENKPEILNNDKDSVSVVCNDLHLPLKRISIKSLKKKPQKNKNTKSKSYIPISNTSNVLKSHMINTPKTDDIKTYTTMDLKSPKILLKTVPEIIISYTTFVPYKALRFQSTIPIDTNERFIKLVSEGIDAVYRYIQYGCCNDANIQLLKENSYKYSYVCKELLEYKSAIRVNVRIFWTSSVRDTEFMNLHDIRYFFRKPYLNALLKDNYIVKGCVIKIPLNGTTDNNNTEDCKGTLVVITDTYPEHIVKCTSSTVIHIEGSILSGQDDYNFKETILSLLDTTTSSSNKLVKKKKVPIHDTIVPYTIIKKQIEEIRDSVRDSVIEKIKTNENISTLKYQYEIFQSTILYPDIFYKSNTIPLRGILLHGPPGIGKNWSIHRAMSDIMLIIKDCIEKKYGKDILISPSATIPEDILSQSSFCFGIRMLICTNSFISPILGESEKRLCNIFNEASIQKYINYTSKKDSIKVSIDNTTNIFPHYNVYPSNEYITYDCIYPIKINLTELYNILYNTNNNDTEQINTLYVNKCMPICTILLFDEIDSIFPIRSYDKIKETNDITSRVVTQMLTLLDGFYSNKYKYDKQSVIIIGTTNHINNIDMSLRRPGRIDREIYIDVPTESTRVNILTKYMKGIPHDIKYLHTLARYCVGFTPADLQSLCREAQEVAFNANMNNKNNNDSLVVEPEHFKKAFRTIIPSSMRDEQFGSLYNKNDSINTDNTTSSFLENIIGLEEMKKHLEEIIQWPLKYKETYKRLGQIPARGILMYGPPGCGKTSIAKSLAITLGLTFLTISTAEIFSSYLGESERIIRELFTKARKNCPCIIFFDEIDSLILNRDKDTTSYTTSSGGVSYRILSTLLNELDGIESSDGILILGATNRIDRIDSALLRPGRFDHRVYISPPTKDEGIKILKYNCRNIQIDSKIQLSAIYDEIYTINSNTVPSASLLTTICKEAIVRSLQRDSQSILLKIEDFRQVLHGMGKPLIATNCSY